MLGGDRAAAVAWLGCESADRHLTVFSAPTGFADDAVVAGSRVGFTEIPGIGFEGKNA